MIMEIDGKLTWTDEDGNPIPPSIKIVDNFDDIPHDIKEKVYKALTEDILIRYDNSSYHNEDLIHNTLEQYGYKIKDEQA